MSQDKVTSGLLAAVTLVLFEHDPVNINFGCNPDEYEPEAKTIISRLNHAKSPNDVLTIVHEEFCHWFGIEIAGTKEKYTKVSEQIFEKWITYNK